MYNNQKLLYVQNEMAVLKNMTYLALLNYFQLDSA